MIKLPTKEEAKRLVIRCQAFNQYLDCCFAHATKRCIDDNGLWWWACDAKNHDTKEGSFNVKVEIFE